MLRVLGVIPFMPNALITVSRIELKPSVKLSKKYLMTECSGWDESLRLGGASK